MSIPLEERILHLALNTGFLQNRLDVQLRQARGYANRCIEKFVTALEVL